MNLQIIKERIIQLRHYMSSNGLSAFIIPSTDPHCGEYVPEHWKVREWISGFTGSAGTVVITLSRSALWTDSRYFIQAEQQLKDTGIQLMKDKLPDTPSITQWLGSTLNAGDNVGLSSSTSAVTTVAEWGKELSGYHISLSPVFPEPWDKLWTDRPQLPDSLIDIHPLKYAGESCVTKLQKIRESIAQNHAESIIISTLDEIAWILNIRGKDVHCNPVVVGYLIISQNEVVFYCQPGKINKEADTYLRSQKISLRPYSEFFNDIKTCAYNSVQIQPDQTNYEIVNSLPLDCTIIQTLSPVQLMKAIKSPQEIAGFKQAMLRDGIAMVRFLYWLEENISAQEITETGVDRALWRFRSEQQLFQDVSFDTIAGYKEHGAIVHYTATPESEATLRPEGFLLLDSGAQYLDGTTDITRTIPLGPLTDEERHDYTLVLKGHIALASVKFPHGTCGTQLDVLARMAMWKEGINYLHGTGHGVGSYLNVHEGPHQVRMNYMPTVLLPGMTLTNEPGIYKAGKHGVRIENTMLITPYMEGEFGAFYQFEPLTLCPIATSPIVMNMLSENEIEWINNYHLLAYNSLSPLLKGKELEWLKKATKEL